MAPFTQVACKRYHMGGVPTTGGGGVNDSVLAPAPIAAPVPKPLVGPKVLCCQVYTTPETSVFTLLANIVAVFPAHTVMGDVPLMVGVLGVVVHCGASVVKVNGPAHELESVALQPERIYTLYVVLGASPLTLAVVKGVVPENNGVVVTGAPPGTTTYWYPLFMLLGAFQLSTALLDVMMPVVGIDGGQQVAVFVTARFTSTDPTYPNVPVRVDGRELIFAHALPAPGIMPFPVGVVR